MTDLNGIVTDDATRLFVNAMMYEQQYRPLIELAIGLALFALVVILIRKVLENTGSVKLGYWGTFGTTLFASISGFVLSLIVGMIVIYPLELMGVNVENTYNLELLVMIVGMYFVFMSWLKTKGAKEIEKKKKYIFVGLLSLIHFGALTLNAILAVAVKFLFINHLMG